MSRYVNPQNVLDPSAEPNTDERVNELLNDSYRTGRVFIKQHIDPVFVHDEEGQVKPMKDTPRQWGVVTFHFFKTPIAVGGDPNKMMFGYYKLRGPGAFPDEHAAHKFASDIFRSHDSYSRMYAVPYGVMQPLCTWEADVADADAEEIYKEEIAEKKEEEEKFIVQQRMAEEEAIKLRKGETENGDLDDYVRNQLRWHAADKRIEQAKKLIKKGEDMLEEADRVMDEASLKINEMLSAHPEYREDGFKYFQRKMVEAGEKEPESYYDQVQYEKEF